VGNENHEQVQQSGKEKNILKHAHEALLLKHHYAGLKQNE